MVQREKKSMRHMLLVNYFVRIYFFIRSRDTRAAMPSAIGKEIQTPVAPMEEAKI